MKGYAGYLLDEASQKKLKEVFPPKFEKFIGHHITTAFNVTEEQTPTSPQWAKVIGYASDDYLETLIIQIDWRLKRKDGVYFHLTWSLNPKERQPKDAGEIAKKWTFIGETIDIAIEPKFFPFKEQSK